MRQLDIGSFVVYRIDDKDRLAEVNEPPARTNIQG